MYSTMDTNAQICENRPSIDDTQSSISASVFGDHATPPPGLMSPPPRPQGHTRSMTFSARNPNRLSLSFPVQPIDGLSSGRQTPVSSEASTAGFPTSVSETKSVPSPKDSGDFMVVIAAQERKVLELKEELNRAESELVRLKRQWVSHEANKKRSEMRHVEQLRPVHNKPGFEPPVDEDHEDSIVRRSVELDRRKAMLIGVAKDSRRKVISGGHTRALSLLSPERNVFQPQPLTQANNGRSPEPVNNLSRATTIPDDNHQAARISSSAQNRYPHQEPVTVDMKQIASDLKAGMWTFLEDLRQATIGEEALQSPPQKLGGDQSAATMTKRSSKSSGKPNGNTRAQSISRTKSTSRTRQAALKPAPTPIEIQGNETVKLVENSAPRSGKKTDSGLSGIDDDWSNWDSPVSIKSPDWGDPMSLGDQSELPNSASRTMKASPSSRDGIPWPALENLSAGNLKRTASAIMKEWERSLSPTPVERHNPLDITPAQEQEASLTLP